jgi:hypothetical protein
MSIGFGPVRSAITIAVLAAWILAGNVTPAVSGPYPVTACNDAAGGRVNAWRHARTAPTEHLEFAQRCPSGSPDPYGDLLNGAGVVDGFRTLGASPDAAFAEWRFDAPLGTAIVSARISRDIGNRDEWTPYGRIDGVDQPGETCVRGMNQSYCRIQGTRTFTGLDAREIAYGVRCVTAPYCAHLWDLRAVWVLILGATVTLDDREAPAVGGVEGGVVDGRWWNRAGVVAFSAEDNTGVRRRRVLVDGVPRVVVDAPGAAQGGCGDFGVGVAYSYSRPCADARGLNGLRSVTVDPCRWGDGVHSVRGGATDTGGLDASSSAPAVARVDCSPPEVSIEGAGEVVAGEVVEPSVLADDATSGLSAVQVERSVDASEWVPHGGTLVAEEGRSYRFRARAVDVAGNASGWTEAGPFAGVAAPGAEGSGSEGAGAEGPGPSGPGSGGPVSEGSGSDGRGEERGSAGGSAALVPDATAAGLMPPPPAALEVTPAARPSRPREARLDPRLRITRVVVKARGVLVVAGTAAIALRTTATVTVVAGGRVTRRRVKIANGAWRLRIRMRRRAASINLATRASGRFRAARAKKTLAPLAHTPAE